MDTTRAQDVDATIRVRAPVPRLPSAPSEGGGAPGEMIGPYELVAILGEGGFGMVWRARQREPILREVALKVIKPGMDSREIISRFEGERQALALMDHPHIAAVLDAGKTEAGRLYFAMELVQGLPLTEHCDAQRLTVRQRLELFVPVCQAVQHAHQKGVLHRDLKPSNILVEVVDGQAVPKIIDFGIAKALQSGDDAAPGLSLLQTQGLSLIGTPLYMSPEQAGLKGQDVDSRSDIYSLGVVLHELLTGTTPLSQDSLKQAAMDEVLRLIREQEPPGLQRMLQQRGAAAITVAEQRHTEIKRLTAQMRGDLEWIVLRALEKDRERRYDSAAALAEDISRHLRDEPVSAGPPGAAYRLGKLARRHKGPLAAAAVVLLSLVSGLVVALWQMTRAIRAEYRAQRHLDEAQTARGTAESIINDMLHDLGGKLKPLGKMELLDQVSRTAEDYFARLPPEQRTGVALLNQCTAWRTRSEVLQAQGRLPEARVAAVQALTLAKQLVAESPVDYDLQSNMADSYRQLADVLSDAGEWEAELEALQARHAINEHLSARAPGNRDWQIDLASSHRAIAWSLRNSDDASGALVRLREAAAIEEKLLEKTPDDDLVLSRAVNTQTMTGSVLRLPKTRDSQGALAADRKALEYTERRARLEPGDMLRQHSLSVCHEKVAWDLRAVGDHAGMLKHRTLQLGIIQRLCQHDPANMEWLNYLGYAHWHMSDAQMTIGNKAGAIESARTSLDIHERLARYDSGNVQWGYDYWRMVGQVANPLRAQGNLSAALALREKAAQTAADLTEQGADWKSEIAANEHEMGEILQAQGDFTAALNQHAAAFNRQAAVLKTAPDDAGGRLALVKYRWGLTLAQLSFAATLLDNPNSGEAISLVQQALGHVVVLLPAEKDKVRLDAVLQALAKTATKLRQHLPGHSATIECDRLLADLRQRAAIPSSGAEARK